MGVLNSDGLRHLVQGIKVMLEKKVDKVDGKGLSTNDYTNEDKIKLSGLSNYIHPDTPGNKHIPYGGRTDQVLRWSSDGTAIWGDDKDTTYEVATASKDGLMGSADKSKLDGIESGANNYKHPTHTSFENGMYKIAVDEQGHVTGAQAVEKQDIVDLGIPAQDTTYSPATQSDDGLMASSDKTKLDSIPTPSSIATQTYVAEQISKAGHITKTIVDSLPDASSAKDNTIYMVLKKEVDEGNSYDEYIKINGKLELIGNTKTVIDAIPNSEIDDLLKT